MAVLIEHCSVWLILETFARFVNKDKKSKNAALCVVKLANNGVLGCLFRLDCDIFSSFSQFPKIEQRSLLANSQAWVKGTASEKK